MDLTWKEVLPVVKVGEKHDPAEEEGDEHEEAVHHINQAVLQQNWVKRQLQGCNFLKSFLNASSQVMMYSKFLGWSKGNY